MLAPACFIRSSQSAWFTREMMRRLGRVARVAIVHRVVWVHAVAAEGGVMFHVSHPRHYGDNLRRVVLASPFILAGAFLAFLLIMVLIGATNGFKPNP